MNRWTQSIPKQVAEPAGLVQPVRLNMTDDYKMEFKKAFEEAFDVILTRMSVQSLDTSNQMTLTPTGIVNVVVSPTSYTINLTCHHVSMPPEGWGRLQWFDLRDCGHALHFISDRQEHPAMLELMYRTIDLEKFVVDLKETKFRRFSQEFHKQLDDILD